MDSTDSINYNPRAGCGVMESEIVKLYKYTITYNHGEENEYDIILVSDNMKDLINLIADREMIDPINGTHKWFEITDFLFVAKEDGKWYHLFDINEQDLAVKFGYDVQEQYWKVNFKGDCPESVKDVNELLWKFENEIGVLNNGIIPCGGILGDALYKSKCVQDAICKKKREIALCEAQELDAGITVIEEIVKGEEKE